MSIENTEREHKKQQLVKLTGFKVKATKSLLNFYFLAFDLYDNTGIKRLEDKRGIF